MPLAPESPLDRLQARLTHTFHTPALLELSLTHSSYLYEHPEVAESNQRLEFLGDSVLQLILTRALFDLFPDDREGILSKRRALLTKGVFLAGLAREIGLPDCLRMASSEQANGGRDRDAALEDCFEALVGALYLDADFPTTRRIVLSLYGPLQDRLSPVEDEENPKGRLQELIHPSHGTTALRYEILSTEGEDHARSFVVGVFLRDRQLGSGTGSSKKQAEQEAARQAIGTLSAEGLAP
jgi:ribonuclease-3